MRLSKVTFFQSTPLKVGPFHLKVRKVAAHQNRMIKMWGKKTFLTEMKSYSNEFALLKYDVLKATFFELSQRKGGICKGARRKLGTTEYTRIKLTVFKMAVSKNLTRKRGLVKRAVIKALVILIHAP